MTCSYRKVFAALNKLVCTVFWVLTLLYTATIIDALWEDYIRYQSIFITKRGISGK